MNGGAPAAWRALLAVLVVGTAWLAFDPHPPPRVDSGWDKLNHVAAFASMALVACLAFPRTPPPRAAAPLALLAYGAFIEAVQSQIPQRSADWHDIVADAIGIAAGLLAAWTWRRSRPT